MRVQESRGAVSQTSEMQTMTDPNPDAVTRLAEWLHEHGYGCYTDEDGCSMCDGPAAHNDQLPEILAALDGEIVPRGTLAQNERLIERTAQTTSQIDKLLRENAKLRAALDYIGTWSGRNSRYVKAVLANTASAQDYGDLRPWRAFFQAWEEVGWHEGATPEFTCIRIADADRLDDLGEPLRALLQPTEQPKP